MNIDPSLLLAMLAEQAAQIYSLRQQVAELTERLAAKDQTQK